MIIIISEEVVKSAWFIDIVQSCFKHKMDIVIVHDVDTKFPGYDTINNLPEDVRTVFDTIAVPYHSEFSQYCWTKIMEKIHRNTKVTICTYII